MACQWAWHGLAARIQKRSYKVIALLSDGECNEGQSGRCRATASAIDNLLVVSTSINGNRTKRGHPWQNSLPTSGTFSWETHKWTVTIWVSRSKLSKFRARVGSLLPCCAHREGKGVSFMEDDNSWHYRIPTVEGSARPTRNWEWWHEMLCRRDYQTEDR
jgi:transketolase